MVEPTSSFTTQQRQTPSEYSSQMSTTAMESVNSTTDAAASSRCVIRLKFNLGAVRSLNFMNGSSASNTTSVSSLLCSALICFSVLFQGWWSWIQASASSLWQTYSGSNGGFIVLVCLWLLSSNCMFSVVVDMGDEQEVNDYTQMQPIDTRP
ncbi:expressed unknown protein [Seminavis robusta]|uniref:Transmembrane protein n=1 Tax=Seminavis robusta TaxID=568900 RepID=A0A9N8H8X4_9STRA|nr:expressed unknown protein [Seminavis robusta]|eukprot:Sro102_g051971.1  (152) ;mRNA; f:39417-39872